MAQAYVPIQTVTVGSGGSTSITFTNIPQTYTDLFLVLSCRVSASYGGLFYQTDVLLNSTGSENDKLLFGYGTTSASNAAGNGQAIVYGVPNSAATANTFGNGNIYISNYTSSNKKVISSESSSESNDSGAINSFMTAVFNVTSAVTSVTLRPYNNASFAQHSTATLYGIGGARASGGTITADARYTYHTFTSTGTFTALEKIKGAEVLCIAGGGGGGDEYAGGGGAGGIAYGTPQLLTSGTSYTVVIGSGGSGAATGPALSGSNGNNSSFSAITAIGGGGGAGEQSGSATRNGSAGGSGGGGSTWVETGKGAGGASTQVSGLNYIGYGNAGGSASPDVASQRAAGGGGGGAGAAGTQAPNRDNGGNGGVGTTLFSSWGYATSTGELSGGTYYYAGGGGGGIGANSTGVNGVGGLGGGGAGGNNSSRTGVSATANTGGGGGGGQGNASGTTNGGGNGGSGLVIIRYPN